MLINKIQYLVFVLFLLTTQLFIAYTDPLIISHELVAKCLQIGNGADYLQKKLTMMVKDCAENQGAAGGISVQPLSKAVSAKVLDRCENQSQDLLALEDEYLLEKIISLHEAMEKRRLLHKCFIGEQQEYVVSLDQSIKDKMAPAGQSIGEDTLSHVCAVQDVFEERLSQVVDSFVACVKKDERSINERLLVIGNYIDYVSRLALDNLDDYKKLFHNVMSDHVNIIRRKLKRWRAFITFFDKEQANNLSYHEGVIFTKCSLIESHTEAIKENSSFYNDKVTKIFADQLASINNYRAARRKYDTNQHLSLFALNKTCETFQVKQQKTMAMLNDCLTSISLSMGAYENNLSEFLRKSVHEGDQLTHSFEGMKKLLSDVDDYTSNARTDVAAMIANISDELIKAGNSLETAQRLAKNDISRSVEPHGSDSTEAIRAELNQLSTSIAEHYNLLAINIYDSALRINSSLDDSYSKIVKGFINNHAFSISDIQSMSKRLMHALTINSAAAEKEVNSIGNKCSLAIASGNNENNTIIQLLLEKKRCILAEQQARLCIKIADAKKNILQDIGRLNNVATQLAGMTVDIIRDSESKSSCILRIFQSGALSMLSAFPEAIKAIFDIEQENARLARLLIIVKIICAILTP